MNIPDIIQRAKTQAGIDITPADIASFLLYALTGDKVNSYLLTRSKVITDSTKVSPKHLFLFSEKNDAFLFLLRELRPMLHLSVLSYVRKNYAHLSMDLDELYEERHTSGIPNEDDLEEIGEEVEFDDSKLKNMLHKALIKLNSNKFNDKTIASLATIVKLLKDKFETTNNDDRTVIELPAPFYDVCPHCHKEI